MASLPRTFPPSGVECRPGDYLVRQEEDRRWRIYRVRDLLALQRLVPTLTTPSGLLAEEVLLDSMAPAYSGELHLLLDLLEPAFDAADAAVQALRAEPLDTAMPGLLRVARDFPRARTQVVTPLPDASEST